MNTFTGSIVAIVTPFKNGRLDLKTLSRQIDFQIKNGTKGIVPCGTTGESPTLSNEEHKKVIASTVEFVKGRVPVIAGTGSNSTHEAVEMTRFAKKAGADATLSVVPYYNKPTQAGLYEHYKAIAGEAGLPVVLYNIPGRSGVGLTIQTIEKLAQVKGVVAIKEATGSMDMTSEIIARTNLTVLSGDDSLTLPLMALGAKGVISVFANLFPGELARMVSDVTLGHWHEARKRHYEMLTLVKTLFIETNPIPVKAAMKLMDMDSGELRLPLVNIGSANLAVLKTELETYKKAIRKS